MSDEIAYGVPNWRAGYRSKISAEVASDEIEKIKSRNEGDITPEMLVKAAKSRKSRLHPAFTWDDTEASQQWRLHEARNMLGAIMIVYEESPKRPVRKYSHVSVSTKKSGKSGESEPSKVYRSTEDALKDPETRVEILQRALNKLITIRQEFSQLQELGIVFREIDKAVETIEL